jgi:hypothetical protein
MSVLAREARREHIQQIMKLINTKIRPAILRAIDETTALKAGSSSDRPDQMAFAPNTVVDTEAPGAFKSTDDKYPNPSAPRAGTAVSNTHTYGVNPLNPTDDHDATGLDPYSNHGRTIEKSKRRIPVDGPTASTSGEGRTLTTCNSGFVKSKYLDRIVHPLPLPLDDRRALSRIAISLRHLRSGHDIPEDIFGGGGGPTSADDLTVLDSLYQSLSRMVQAIDRRVAAIAKTATERFDRHMASLEAQSEAQSRRPRHFEDQEEWQTRGEKKKTRWNPDADWGEEMVWSEVEVGQGEPVRRRAGSRLRYNYIPDDGTRPPPPEESSYEEEESSMWW